jgi:DNA-binding NtrC family response regulator
MKWLGIKELIARCYGVVPHHLNLAFLMFKREDSGREMAMADTHPALRNSRVLIASSNEEFRRQWVGDPQFVAADIEEAAGGADALSKLESQDWSEVLLDRGLHDLDVSEVVSIIRSRHPHLLVRLVDSDLHIEGSQDSSAAPNDISVPYDEGIGIVNVRAIEAVHPRVQPLPGMLGVGPGLEHIFKLARLVGPRRTIVLIMGETGTGKELVARGIHEISPRSKTHSWW